jgi:hypothetical protein
VNFKNSVNKFQGKKQMKRLIFLLLSLMLILYLPACASSATATQPIQILTPAKSAAGSTTTSQPNSPSGQEVSFSKDIFPIFQQYSDAHHGSDSMLSLVTYDGVMLDVVPGQPEQSKLYLRLIGQGGPVMPPGNPLPEKLITLIYNWIKQGAKNN